MSTTPYTPTADETFVQLPKVMGPGEYNYSHFTIKHLIQDGRRTVQEKGIEPGAMAPDFDLFRVGGGTIRLSELRGEPVLLHFGSLS